MVHPFMFFCLGVYFSPSVHMALALARPRVVHLAKAYCSRAKAPKVMSVDAFRAAETKRAETAAKRECIESIDLQSVSSTESDYTMPDDSEAMLAPEECDSEAMSAPDCTPSDVPELAADAADAADAAHAKSS